MESPVRALYRLLLYAAWTFALLPAQVVALVLRISLRKHIPQFYHRVCCRIIGLKIEARGEISTAKPTLFIVNHSSYLDISVLGSLIKGAFVAKREVAGWALFGILARLQRTVFVDRRPRFAAVQRDELMRRLEAGDNLILFPEGTSSDGNRILPFKSALLGVAEYRADGRPVTVQPVSIAYTRLDGMPLGRHLRPYYAWYGEMDLASHVWQMMGLGKATVVVAFHPPVSVAEFGSRKALTQHCHDIVARGVAAAISGRPQDLPAATATR